MSTGWISTTLDSVAEVAAGQAAPQGSELFGADGHPFVRAGSLDFLVNGGSEMELEYISSDVADAHRLRLFPAATVVFAKSGMSATKGLIYRLKEPCYVVSHLAALIPCESLAPEYLTRWLEAHPPTALISNSAYPSIRLSQVAGVSMQLPEHVDEQRRIAAILDGADAVQHKRRKAIRLLDDFLRSVFLDMFGDPVANPKGWETQSIGDALSSGLLLDMQDGNHGERHPKVSDFSDSGVPFITANCLRDGQLHLEEAYMLPHEWRNVLRVGFSHGGDALLSHKGTVGEVAVVPDEIELVILSPQVTYYRPSEELESHFLAGMFASPSFQRLLAKGAEQSTRAYIGITRQKDLTMIVPPAQMQKRFATIARSVGLQKVHLQTHLAELETLFASTQQRAFTGEL